MAGKISYSGYRRQTASLAGNSNPVLKVCHYYKGENPASVSAPLRFHNHVFLDLGIKEPSL